MTANLRTVQATSEALRKSASSGTPTSPNVAGGDRIARGHVDCYVEEIRRLLAARDLRWLPEISSVMCSKLTMP